MVSKIVAALARATEDKFWAEFSYKHQRIILKQILENSQVVTTLRFCTIYVIFPELCMKGDSFACIKGK
jgi:hypothetical protein